MNTFKNEIELIYLILNLINMVILVPQDIYDKTGLNL